MRRSAPSRAQATAAATAAPDGRGEAHRSLGRLRKAAFILPNMFTLSGMFCGFYAILLVAGTPGPREFYRACLSVFFGIFFDMADGRIARLTRTQSDFGVQIDSLADVMTFGMAPAVILHAWALTQWAPWGALVAFVYVACGAMRLARFNVMAAHLRHDSGRFFVGLPIPLAAGLMTSAIMVHQRGGGRWVPSPPVGMAVLAATLGILMVSRVRYRTFKHLEPTPWHLGGIGAVTSSFIVLSLVRQPTFALWVLFVAYTGWGLLEALYRRCSRKMERGRRIAPPP